jgi:hypothetical protein
MILQKNPAWSEILGGLLGTAGSYMQAHNQEKVRQQEQARQKAIDAQNAQLTALAIAQAKGGLTSKGLDAQGNPLPMPGSSPMAPVGGAPPGPPPGALKPSPGIAGGQIPGLQSLLGQGKPSPLGDPLSTLPANTPSPFPGASATTVSGPQAPPAPKPSSLSDQANQALATAVALQQAGQTERANQFFTTAKNLQDAAATETTQGQETALAHFRQGLKNPAGWAKMTPEQQTGYLRNRLLAAQRMGDKDTVTETQKEIEDINNPAIKQAQMQQQMQMLQLRLQDADKRQDRLLQARLIAAMDRVGRGGQLTSYQLAELGIRSEDLKEKKREFAITHPGGQSHKPSTQDARSSDYADAGAAIAGGADRDKVVKRYAAKWNIAPDKADDLFP